MPNSNKKEMFVTILAIITMIAGVVFIAMDKQEVVIDDSSDIVVTPDIDKPDVSQDQNGVELLSTDNLLREPYIPSRDVYTSNYEEEVLRLALNGEFKVAKIEVEGEVFGEGLHFISLNFEGVSGVLNASKKSKDQLNLKETKILGGIFVKGIPTKFEIDLKKETILAKTKEEFEEGESGSKKVILWDHLNFTPPTVINFLFAPFNEYGQYGGMRITSIKFKYLCEDGSSCSVVYCPRYKMFTECLANNFGLDAAIDWCNRSKLKGCDIFAD